MAQLIIHNAAVITQNIHQPNAQAIAVNEGKIIAVGTNEELLALKESHTKIIDASGKTLMPGFNDTHIHVWKVGNLKTFLLDVRSAKSKDEMLEMLSSSNKKNAGNSWLTARGFNEALWSNATLPTKNDLDKVSTIRPVMVIRTCAHICVCNSKALEICNITKDTIVPAGGMMYMGEDGKPNGIFAETALGLITKNIPPYTKDELKIMVNAAQEEMLQYGITAATDPAVEPLLLQAYKEMNVAGELKFRLHAMPIILPDGEENPYPIPQKFSSPFLNVNTVKFFSDGGLSGKTAALKRTYKNSTDKGLLRLEYNKYKSLCKQSMENDLAIATHAIGDDAIEFVINVYEELHKSFPQISNRIEHLGLPEKNHLQRMAANNIAASMQTIFLYELGKNFIGALDEDYLNRCYPVASAMNAGIKVALSSDAPVVKDFNPVAGVAAAVTRKTRDENIIAAHESISISEALKAYTSTAAEISFAIDYGSLKEEMNADFILLNKNPLALKPNEINTLQVEKTFVDGKCVWKK